MMAAGVGFRGGIAAEEIVAAVEAAMGRAPCRPDRLSCLATLASRAGEAGFLEAARRLGIETLAVARERLTEAGGQVETRSERVLALHGVGSVAEAAALSAAGAGARLVVRRIVVGRATCALAAGGARAEDAAP